MRKIFYNVKKKSSLFYKMPFVKQATLTTNINYSRSPMANFYENPLAYQHFLTLKSKAILADALFFNSPVNQCLFIFLFLDLV